MDIFYAIKQNHIQSIKTMIDQDPSVIHHRNNFHETPLHFSCDCGYADIAKLLIDAGGDVHSKDRLGRTPLYWACYSGHTDVTKLLIDAGASVHVKDQNGWTYLHLACQHDYTDLSRLLIDAGADVNAKDGNGWTPLHWTCDHGSKEIAKLFIETDADADWLAVNKNSQTPIDLAMDNNRTYFLHFVEGFIDQLPPPEQTKLRAWRFRREMTKTS